MWEAVWWSWRREWAGLEEEEREGGREGRMVERDWIADWHLERDELCDEAEAEAEVVVVGVGVMVEVVVELMVS